MLHPHPSPAPALTDTSGKSRGQWGRGKGRGWNRSSGPRPALFSGFKDEGEHSSEWDLKLVSKTPSKGSFQPALSIVSLAAKCRPPQPLRVGWGGHWPPPRTGTPGTRGFTGPWGFCGTWSPNQEEQGSTGCHVAPQPAAFPPSLLLLPALWGRPSSPAQLLICTFSLCSKHLVWGRVSGRTSTDRMRGALA